MARQGPVTVTDHINEDPRDKSSKEPTYADQIGNPSDESLLSPGFKSVITMAGWDEETLLFATLVVEDTPDRDMKHKRRPDLQFKTPPTNSRRKRRSQRKSPMAVPITILNLDDDEEITTEETEDGGKKKTKQIVNDGVEEKKAEEKEIVALKSSEASCSSSSIPCMDKLREELSCAICLEICFEPSTTPCGHSFCKKCLRSAADKCGKKCPKCRQLFSNGRSCTVNTVLWNTIQLLFPQEIEARKVTSGPPSNSRESHRHGRESSTISNHSYTQNRNVGSIRLPSSSARVITLGSRREIIPHQIYEDHRRIRPITRVSSSRQSSGERRRRIPGQNEDAAMALRLQREEFMEAFRANNNEQIVGSISLARDNLRAMATRAMHIRLQDRPMASNAMNTRLQDRPM